MILDHWLKDEEQIEGWYEESRKVLDSEFRRQLRRDIGDAEAKRRYQRKLVALKERYEAFNFRLHRWELLQRRIRASPPSRLWRWLRALPRRIKQRLRPSQEE